MSSNKYKSFEATSPEMEAAMEDLVNSDKYIVITEKVGEQTGRIGKHNAIHHDWGGPAKTSEELVAWSFVMDDKAAHEEQLKDMLGDSGIIS